MKSTLQLITIILFCGLLPLEFSAQAKSIYGYWQFEKNEVFPSSYSRFIEISSKNIDMLGKGLAGYVPRDVTQEDLDFVVNPYNLNDDKYGYGNYFVVEESDQNLDFSVIYGYVNREETFKYTKVEGTFISSLVNEPVPYQLSFREFEYDCEYLNYFDCNTYQREEVRIKNPGAIVNKQTKNVRFLIFRFYMQEEVVESVIFPILIVGNSELMAGTTEAFQLHTILRPPPGDESSATIQKNTSFSSETSFSINDASTLGISGTVGAEISASVGPFSGGNSAEYTTSTEYTKSNTNTKSVISTFTSSTEITADDGSDVFVVEKFKYDYGFFFYSFAEPTSNGLVRSSGVTLGMTLKPNKLVSQHYWSQKNLLESQIEKAERAGRYSEANYQRALVELNNRLKAKAEPWKQIEFSGSRLTESFESSLLSSESISQEISLEQSESVTIESEGGIDLGPISVGGSASSTLSKTYKLTQTRSNTASVGSSQTISYTIDDDDEGDFMLINVNNDRVFGTLAFSLDPTQSETSCPYEGGIKRDQPQITVVDPITKQKVKEAKYSNLPVGSDDAVFEVELTNNSAEKRSYVLKQGNSNAKLTIGGLNSNVDALEMNPGENIKLLVLVEQLASSILPYPDIKFILQSECDPAVGDTVLLSVFFGDSDINRAPDNDMVCSALEIPADGSLVTEYIDQFNTVQKISNKNAVALPNEQSLVFPLMNSGWQSESMGLPVISNSVWFKFVPRSTNVLISTCEMETGNLDTQIAVYSTSNCEDFNSFNLIGANDNGCGFSNGGVASYLYMENLTVGDTLYLLVDGYSGAQGDFGIRISSPAPQNDNDCLSDFLSVNGLLNQGTLPLGKGDNFHYDNYFATTEDNENLLLPPSTNKITGWTDSSIDNSVWFSFAAPDLGNVIIDVYGVSEGFDPQISLYSTNGNICGSEFFSSFRFEAANDDATILGGNTRSQIKATGLDPDRNYVILVDGNNGSQGQFDIKLSEPAPINDEVCGAILLTANGIDQGPFDNGGATSSASEQSIAPSFNEEGFNGWSEYVDADYAFIEKSVWFKFVAPSSGEVEISTCNKTNFITQLALYNIDNCDDLSSFDLLSADDNSGLCQLPPDSDNPNGSNARGSIINYSGLTPDKTYYILVDGAYLDYGTFKIAITTPPSEAPSNDMACSAIMLPANGVVQKGYTNLGATVEPIESTITPNNKWADASMNSTVWFSFVAPGSGEVEISTCNMANFDTQLALYSSNDCSDFGTYSLIASNEDGPQYCATDGDSFLAVKGLTPGTLYYIVVDGYGTYTGNFDIVINNEIAGAPLNDDVDQAILLPVNGVIQTGFTNVNATATTFEQSIKPIYDEEDCINGWCDDQVDNSVWFKFEAPSDGSVIISTCDLATFDTQLALYAAANVTDFSTFELIASNDAGPEDCSTNYDSYLPVDNLIPGEIYFIMVDGFNGDIGNFDIVLSRLADTEQPTQPTNLSTIEVTTSTIEFEWEEASDNYGVVMYEVYLDNEKIDTTSESSFIISELTEETKYSIFIVAVDEAGNRSEQSANLEVTTLSNTSTSVSENDLAIKVKVYPNPFVENIIIEIPADGPELLNVNLIDLDGKVLKSIQSLPTHTGQKINIQLNGIPSGIYVIVINTSKGIISKNIVKQ